MALPMEPLPPVTTASGSILSILWARAILSPSVTRLRRVGVRESPHHCESD